MRASRPQGSSAHAVRLATVGAAVALALGVAGVTLATHSWANGLVEQERLLPGTTVGGVDVGGMEAREAQELVQETVDAHLDQPRSVTYDDQTWRVTPRELGTTADVGAAMEEALDRTADAGTSQLFRVRWLGGAAEGHLDVDVPIDLDEGQVAAFVNDVADEVDRAPLDATAEWTGDGVRLIEHRVGRETDREALADDLAQALRGGGEVVELRVEDLPVGVTADQVEPVLPALRDRIAAAFGERLRVVAQGEDTEHQWEARPQDIGAVPDVKEMMGTLADDGQASGGAEATADETGPDSAEPAPLTVDEEELEAYVDMLAGQVYDAPENADVALDDDGIDITEDAPGRQLDREDAMAALGEAIRNGRDQTQLSIEPATPEVTADDYEHVLVLRQDDRRLSHYADGEKTGDWPVAVGAGGSPTPTGQFTVGEKRHKPTWHNPDPGGWGSDMPAVVEPGPDNPLGLRALNWYDNGTDTLIRFHGTAATDSIGRAASQGCVRLRNDDVVELYDRVPTGATILSVG